MEYIIEPPGGKEQGSGDRDFYQDGNLSGRCHVWRHSSPPDNMPVHGCKHAQTQEAAVKRINSSSARKIKWILAKRASQAVNEANASTPRLYHWPSKTASRWNPCRCLICNMDFDMMTNLHAENHGFASADELIASGNVRFT